MRIGKIIGKVTLSTCHPSVQGATWRIVVPLDQDGLRGEQGGRGDPFILLDELGSGNGSIVAVSEGAEAAAPFHPEQKPIDAYCAALLDHIELVIGRETESMTNSKHPLTKE